MADEDKLSHDDEMLSFQPKPVHRPREQVESQLRDAILGGALKQGEKLPTEVEMAAQFGVSRTTIREALRHLVAQGLIQKLPGASGGSFVLAIDHRSLAGQLRTSVDAIIRLGTATYGEVREVRRFLEIPSARLAAENRTEEHLSRLRGYVEAVKKTALGDTVVTELDIAFHTTIAEATNNRLVESFVAALHHVARPAEHLRFSEEAGRTTVRQHVDIVRAIQNGDADAAELAMRTHLNYLESLASADEEQADASATPTDLSGPRPPALHDPPTLPHDNSLDNVGDVN